MQFSKEIMELHDVMEFMKVREKVHKKSIFYI